jgi:hypothetical protein
MLLWPVLDVIYSLGVVLAVQAFLRRYWPEATLVVPAGVVLISATMLMISSAYELVRVTTIHWNGPVSEIQRILGELAVMRIRRFKWIVLLAPLVGLSLVIISIQWALDINVVRVFDRKWVVINVAVAVLFIPIGWLGARWLARRWQGRRFWQRILDDVSGASLQAARSDLKRWSALHSELDRTRSTSGD